MSQQTSTIAAHETGHALAASSLSDLVVPCQAGHGKDKTFEPCPEPAVFAVRTHEAGSGDPCPRVALLCEPHLEAVRERYARQWAQISSYPRVLVCAFCHRPLTSLQDLIWGIERITP